MGKLPYIQFYVSDWLSDPNVSMLSPLSRGIWIDILCSMHNNGRSGEISGSVQQFSRLTRSTVEEFEFAIKEIKETKTADVIFCNSNVTVINRRMNRESKDRDLTRERVRKYRSKKEDEEDSNDDVPKSNAFSEYEDEYIYENKYEIKDKEIIERIIKEFYEIQKEQYPKLVKDLNDKIIKECLLEIDKIIRIDKFTIDDIEKLLKFVVSDEFWNKQILSLANIRHKSKNGNPKYVNAMVSMNKKEVKYGID